MTLKHNVPDDLYRVIDLRMGQIKKKLNARKASPIYANYVAEVLRHLVNGKRLMVDGPHIINCDTDPMVPEHWSVEEHIKGGQFNWNPDEVSLYICDEQNGSIQGNELRKKLEDKPVLNANVLDYLLANTHLIPEEWKGKPVFFWGTIYRRSDSLFVRCLGWEIDDEWNWYCSFLGCIFDGSVTAAMSASI